MKRFEIEEQLDIKVKGKSWIVRKIWPLVKDMIVDLVWEFIVKYKKTQ